jgi:hypothetical protein
MKAMVIAGGRSITRAESALSMPISSMTMAIIGRPAVSGTALAYCCQGGRVPLAGGGAIGTVPLGGEAGAGWAGVAANFGGSAEGTTAAAELTAGFVATAGGLARWVATSAPMISPMPAPQASSSAGRLASAARRPGAAVALLLLALRRWSPGPCRGSVSGR